MRGEGLEPSRPIRPQEPKSCAYADSATHALQRVIHCVLDHFGDSLGLVLRLVVQFPSTQSNYLALPSPAIFGYFFSELSYDDEF